MTKVKKATGSRSLGRFLEGVLADWLREQAQRLGYAPERRAQLRIQARKIVAAALKEAA